ncbi:hypothetical protein KEM48_000956 [Puccinia striiformis f. sp. tritici PST-130]|nr:hypothetical protein KEM48_000956 [Puccinia striiformis f. sp. tritici PST-130]
MEVFVSRTLHTIKVMANCLNASELVVAKLYGKVADDVLENNYLPRPPHDPLPRAKPIGLGNDPNSKLSADPPEEENGEGAREKSIQEALDVMKWTITWFDGLESDIVEDHWRISTFRIDNLLHELLILVDPTVYPHITPSMKRGDSSFNQSSNSPNR